MRVLDLEHIFATTVSSYTKTDVPGPSNRPLIPLKDSWLLLLVGVGIGMEFEENAERSKWTRA